MKALIRSLLIFGLLFYSCGKDDFTKPTDTAFSFVLQGTSPSVDYLSFHHISLKLQEFEFEGQRLNAPDFFFEQIFEDDLELEWPAKTAVLKFDIPQGLYESVEVSFRLSNRSESTLLIEGIYQSLANDRNLPFVLEFDSDQSIEEIAMSSDGSENIVFTRDMLNEIEIQLDIAGLLRNIERDQLEDIANSLQADDTLSISNDQNRALRDLLESDLKNNIQVIFKW